jgi:hypothetical protein
MTPFLQFFKMAKNNRLDKKAEEKPENKERQPEKHAEKYVNPPKTPPHQMIPEPTSPPGAPARRTYPESAQKTLFEKREECSKGPLIGSKEGC